MHYDWLTFIIAALAIFRAARMITDPSEDGPFFIFKRFRDAHMNDKSSFDKGIHCFYCVSFWASLPVVVLLVIVGGWDVWLWPLWWFGLAGTAVKIHQYWNAKA